MSLYLRREQLKLDMLEALARSQHALASMLEQMAAVTEVSPHAAKQMIASAETLARYQQSLAECVSAIRFPRIRKGRPGKAWLAAGVQPARRPG